MIREWTEEDEIQLREDRKNWHREKIRKIREDAQKRYDTQYENYQSTGAPSAERAMNKWQDLLDVCALAEQALSQSCYRCDLRYKHGKSLRATLEEREKSGETTIKIGEAIGMIADVSSY